MTNQEKNRINDFVRLWSYEDAKGLLICAIIMTITITPIMAFSASIQTGERISGSIWLYIIIMNIFVLVFSLFTLVKIKKQPIIMHLFFAFSSLIFSLSFMAAYYTTIYKIIKMDNQIYLIGGLLGYIIILVSLFYYRYRVYKGYSKNFAGIPQYGVIVSFAILGGIVFRAVMSKAGENIQQLILAFIALLVSYAMAFGIVLIINFAVGMKYRNEIGFREVNKSTRQL